MYDFRELLAMHPDIRMLLERRAAEAATAGVPIAEARASLGLPPEPADEAGRCFPETTNTPSRPTRRAC